VASHALDALCFGGWDSRINLAGLRAVCAEEISITGGCVALGAGSGHFRGIISIPVAERLTGNIIVAGTYPFAVIRDSILIHHGERFSGRSGGGGGNNLGLRATSG